MTHARSTLNDIDDMNELVDANIPRVDLVDKAANGLSFVLMKSEQSPNLLDANSVRELIKQAEEPTMTDTITKADNLDVTTPLAEPETSTAATNVNEPGSAAWEAVDAATAGKWASILARAKNALLLLAGREATEAVAGDGEAGEVYQLEDAAAAVDYAISTLAAYGAGEQAEVDLSQELMKSLDAMSVGDLEQVEGFGQIVKAGRTLSTANESALRSAADSIQKVLASLPAAPEELTKEEAVAAAPVIKVKLEVDRTELDEVIVDVTKVAALIAVYDQDGALLGAVKDGAITPLSSGKPENAAPAEPDADEMGPADAEPGSDEMDPEPAAAAGTPADANKSIADDTVAKADEEDAQVGTMKALIKAAIDAERSNQTEVIKSLRDEINFLKAPATSRVASHGAVPPARDLRGQDRMAQDGGDVVKSSVELREALEKAAGTDERQIIQNEMQRQANAELARVRAGAHRTPMGR